LGHRSLFFLSNKDFSRVDGKIFRSARAHGFFPP
jgi:hypothetical protein